MNFTISQNSLLTVLSLIQRVVSTKQSLPILEMVKISSQEKSVTLEATDLTIGVTVTLLTEVKKEGNCVTPIKSFFAQLATLPQQDLVIKSAESGINVTSGSIQLTFPTGNTADFPELQQVKGKSWKLSKEIISKTSQLVLPSSAKDQVRPILSSVLFTQSGDDLEVVATDGIRLSIYRSQNEKLPQSQILLPGRAVLEISKILESTELEEVEIKVSEDQQIIETQIGNIRFFSKMVAGEFPPYNKIIPSESKITVQLDKSDLEENVKRSVLIGGREAGYFQLAINSGKTVFLTKNQSGESVESIIASRGFKGEPVVISFSSRYVLDMLRSLSDQEVSLLINDPLKPVVFTAESEPNFKFIIMPFKVRE